METVLILYMLGYHPLFDMSMDRIEYLTEIHLWEVDDEQNDGEENKTTMKMTMEGTTNVEETTMKMGTKEKKVQEQKISKSWDFHQNLSFLPTFVRGVIPNVHRHYYALIKYRCKDLPHKTTLVGVSITRSHKICSI